MAAVETVDITGSNASNTTFRAWAQNVSSHMLDFGMVNVSNNITWSTIATPTVANQRVGYEIWRFNDALQATAPVYLRLDYGSAATNTWPAMAFQIGSGVDPANTATLTGSGVTRPNTHVLATQVIGSSAEHCYFAGNTGRLNIWMFNNKDSNATIFCAFGLSIERTKNALGADTGQGLLITTQALLAPSGGHATAYWDCVLGFLTAATSGIGCFETPMACLVPALGTGARGSNVATYPIFHSLGNAFANPGMGVMAYFNADIANNVTFTQTVYGGTHTYMPMSNATILQTGFRSGGGANSIGLCIRYE